MARRSLFAERMGLKKTLKTEEEQRSSYLIQEKEVFDEVSEHDIQKTGFPVVQTLTDHVYNPSEVNSTVPTVRPTKFETEEDEISWENQEKVSQMNPQEILEARNELEKRFDPALLEVLRKRSKPSKPQPEPAPTCLHSAEPPLHKANFLRYDPETAETVSKFENGVWQPNDEQGFNLSELVGLAQSALPSQRPMALQAIARVLAHTDKSNLPTLLEWLIVDGKIATICAHSIANRHSTIASSATNLVQTMFTLYLQEAKAIQQEHLALPTCLSSRTNALLNERHRELQGQKYLYEEEVARQHDNSIDESSNDTELSAMDFVGAVIRMGLLNTVYNLQILEACSLHSITAWAFVARTQLTSLTQGPLSYEKLTVLRNLARASRSIAFTINSKLEAQDVAEALAKRPKEILPLLTTLARFGYHPLAKEEMQDVCVDLLQKQVLVVEILEYFGVTITVPAAVIQLSHYRYALQIDAQTCSAAFNILSQAEQPILVPFPDIALPQPVDQLWTNAVGSKSLHNLQIHLSEMWESQFLQPIQAAANWLSLCSKYLKSDRASQLPDYSSLRQYIIQVFEFLDTKWSAEPEPLPYVLVYRTTPLIQAITSLLELQELTGDKVLPMLLPIRIIRWFGAYEEARLRYTLVYHVFPSKVIPESDLYLGLLLTSDHLVRSERLLLKEQKGSTYMLCNTENPWLPLPRNWILRVPLYLQMEVLQLEKGAFLSPIERADVVNEFLSGERSGFEDVIADVARDIPAVEDSLSLRKLLTWYLEGSFWSPITSRWLVSWLVKSTATSLRYHILSELGLLLPNVARAVGKDCFRSLEDLTAHEEPESVLAIYRQLLPRMPEDTFMREVMVIQLAKICDW